MHNTEEKQGYKFTEEFGYIPEDWGYDKLYKYCSICTGKGNTQDSENDGIYPFYVRSPIIERSNNYLYDGEAVLTVGDGVGTGKVFHYINGKFNFHQRVYKLSDFVNLNGKFFFYLFSSFFGNRVNQMTAKSSVDSVRLEMISQMYILLPPLSEQEKIAEVLSDIDELIASTQKLIDKKKDLKTATMQKLLTPKPHWVKKCFDDVFRRLQSKKYQINSTDYSTEGRYPIVDQGHNKICGYTDNSKVLLKNEDGIIVFGDHTRIIKFIDFDFVVGADGTQLIIANDKYNIKFLYYLLKLKDIPNTGYNRHFKFLLEQNYIIPIDIKEQQQIAQTLSDMDAEIEALEKELSKYKDLKTGMMQELLTGKKRLV